MVNKQLLERGFTGCDVFSTLLYLWNSFLIFWILLNTEQTPLYGKWYLKVVLYGICCNINVIQTYLMTNVKVNTINLHLNHPIISVIYREYIERNVIQYPSLSTTLSYSLLCTISLPTVPSSIIRLLKLLPS